MRVNLEGKSAVALLKKMQGGELPVNAAFISGNAPADCATLMFVVDGQDSDVWLTISPSGLFTVSTEVKHD